ncbi:Zinc finger, RING-type [Dillenia turbinata]|uniref:RING-type E3 ubiquitin transferase n=1 Tax=Dillenia turbinata TaxID=194707 RepID=A0AAN8Z850_9MAGN
MICSMSESRREHHGWSMEHAKHTHLKMSWIHPQIKQKDVNLAYATPYFATFVRDSIPPTSTSTSSTSSVSSGTKISPAVLFIIVIFAVLFFISGLLHLLVRFLIKHPSSSSASQSNTYPEISGSNALQRQLQQLFHLHDSGLDQAFIDALPVFLYKEIVGLKEPFDCAVCLCEFTEKDKLRLLPMCSHAFHINCIDTWLLSNSTCPLCRGTLFAHGFAMENPMFDYDDVGDEDGHVVHGENGFSLGPKRVVDIEEAVVESGVLPVRLGKFRKLNDGGMEAGGGETSSSNLDARRCYSMGSYQYVVDDSDLRVALGQYRNGGADVRLVKEAGHNGDSSVVGDVEGKKIMAGAKVDSFSVSKIWLWSKKSKFPSSSNTQMDALSSVNMNFPWTERKQGG